MSLRVAVITSLFPSPPRPREGIFAFERYRALAERGHRVLVVRPVPRAPWGLVRGAQADFRRMPGRERRAAIELLRPRYWHLPGRDLGNARRFARVALESLRAERDAPDALVLDYAWPAAMALEGARSRGWPTLISGRGSDILAVAEDPRLAPQLARALAGASGRLAVSLDLCKVMDQLAQRGATALLPNGVDRQRFQPGDRTLARMRLGQSGASVLILVVGHLIPRKDPLRALSCFAEGAPASARLVFLGRGELALDLRREIDRLGLGARVEVRPETSPEALADWYRAADVLLLTSRREGRPNVVLEALASGTPVLATAVGGTPELLEGLPECLAPDGSAAAIAESLRALLLSPPSQDRLTEAAAGYSWEASAKQLEGLLEAAILNGYGS